MSSKSREPLGEILDETSRFNNVQHAEEEFSGEFLVKKLELKKIPPNKKIDKEEFEGKENLSARQNILTTDDKFNRIYLGQSDM